MKMPALLALLAITPLAAAAPLLDDGFDHGPWSITPASNPNYAPHHVDLGGTFLNNRDVAAAESVTPGGSAFTVSEDGGFLGASGTGVNPVMQVSYYSAGETDLTPAASVSFAVASDSLAERVYLGLYSDGYASYSTASLALPAGLSGTETFLFSSLATQSGPIRLDRVDRMFLVFEVPSGGSVVLDRLTVDAVPEPATWAALALGAGVALRRRR